MTKYGRFPVRSAEEAAELIFHGASLGIGGFTDPGCPHAVPRALAKRAREFHQRGEPFQVRILSGAEAGPAVDVDLVQADAVSFRMPFQLEKPCRDAINAGKIDFADIHLSHCSQQLFEGFFGKIDFAVIEASDISDDGRVYFTTAIGNGPTYLQLAEKVVIEINRHHPARVREFSDILALPLPPHREPIPIRHPLDRIGALFAMVDPAKVVAIVETDEPSTRQPPRQPDAVSKKIAEHLVRFFLDELATGRVTRESLPLQSGVGNVGNALLAGLGEHPDLPAFTLYTEVFQDSCVDLMRSGRLTGASSTALTLSEAKLREIYDDLDYFGSRIVLRPQEISNNPSVIRQLGVIATNTALEVDIYGHVNSSHVCGTQMMNGIGGAGDFERNALLSVFVCPSIAKGGRISAIVPFCSHVDHSEHSVHVVVTEQGMADLRGLGPAERARRLIDRCAHPAYRDYLHRYVEGARAGHIRHDLTRCFELHRNLIEHGAMLPGLDLNQFSPATPGESSGAVRPPRGATMIEKELKILNDFQPVSYDAWKAQAVADLKGVPFEKKMITHTYEGIDVQPIYTPESWPSANDPSGFPGSLPYTRGTRPLGHSLDGWDMRQEVLHPEPTEVNRIVLEELHNGVTSVELKLDAAASAGLDADDPRSAELCGREGVMVYSLGDLDQAFKGVQMDLVPVSLEAGAAFLPAAALLAALWEERGVKGSKALGAFNADPLGTLMRDGALPQPLDVALLHMTDLAAWTTSHLPNVSSVRVSTAVYHHAGADSVQDLAFAVGTAVEYLRAMTAAGLEFNAAVRQIAFHETVGCKFFQSIAKLRALRKLWAKAIEACGADVKAASGARMIVETSRRVITHRDHWVNLLRNTAATFAGAVAGADAIITLPMDVAVGLSDESTRRLARSTQLILQEECHLNQTVDPAGGSWFLEKLTDEMAEKAWSLFQRVEGQGGMIKAATSGWIRDQIQAVEKRREQDIATRKAAITGVSEHPDVFEKELSRPTPNYPELRAKAAGMLLKWRHDRRQGNSIAALDAVVAKSGRGIGELMTSAVEVARAGATIGELTSTLAGPVANRQGASTTPLTAHPYAAAYEQLRDMVDAYAGAHGDKRPRVFLANLGTAKEFLARSNYARDFFEAGGFEPVGNDGFTDAQAAAAAFAKSQADIAVICSTDARYATDVEQVAPKLLAAGARTVVLAGNPGSNEARYRAAGVNQFIFLKCNVLEILRSLLHQRGVLP